jgi:CBS domain-containing protein
MTTPAQTIIPHTGLVVAARRLHDRGVRRLLVVDENGRLAGVLTRNDLLRVFLRRDDDIEADVEGILRRWEPALHERARASVRDGVVTVRGEVGSQDDVDALVTVIELLDGVVEVVADELWCQSRNPDVCRRSR